ncbi:MAG: hypothetical protein IKD43_04525 [Clostridia bacterium]|nr:hypothetical protein [Clostridia bacterium]
MRLEKSLFEEFLKGVKEWLPSYYHIIVDTATIDNVGYKMGFDKEPAYIFDFELSDEKINELKTLSNNLKRSATENKTFDEELFKKYDSLAGFISIIDFNYK